MTDQPTWNENKVMMASLWPRWKPTPEQGALINERWANLHQDKLRSCIRDDAMHSRTRPNIPAIHRAYCRMTGSDRAHDAGSAEIERTRRKAQECASVSPEELSEWDSWAEEVLSTATAAERKAVTERLGIAPASPRVLAIAVDYIRRNHAAR